MVTALYSNIELMELNIHHTFHLLKAQTRPYTLVAHLHSRQSLLDIILHHLLDFRPHPHSHRRLCREIIAMLHNMVDHNIVRVIVKGKTINPYKYWYFYHIIYDTLYWNILQTTTPKCLLFNMIYLNILFTVIPHCLFLLHIFPRLNHQYSQDTYKEIFMNILWQKKTMVMKRSCQCLILGNSMV